MNSLRGCSSVLGSRGFLVCVSKGDRALQLFDCWEWKGSSQQSLCQASAPKAPLQPMGRAGNPRRSPPWRWKRRTRAPRSLTMNLPKVGLGCLSWCCLSLLSSNLNFPAISDGICSFPFYKATLKPQAISNCFADGQKSLQRVKGLGPVQVQEQFGDLLLIKAPSEL